jgi:hypothetical protein
MSCLFDQSDDKQISWHSLAKPQTPDKVCTDTSLLPFPRAFGKMLTSTYVDTKSFSYPIGSTPAGDLLRDLRPGEEPVEILTLGCGDVRNILFTIWSQQHNTCKLNFTACDLDPAVLGKHASIATIFKLSLWKATALLNRPLWLSTTQLFEFNQIVSRH